MHITLISIGSRGDIQPYVALGVALKRAGYDIQIAIPENFEAFATSQGLDFRPIRGDWQALLQGEAGKMLMSSGVNLIQTSRALSKLMEPIIAFTAQDMWAAAQQTDLVICHSALTLFTNAASQKLGIPVIRAEPVPLIPTRVIPSPMSPVQRNLGGWLNHATGRMFYILMWQMFRKPVNRLRGDLGLSPYRARDYFHYIDQLPMLEALSAQVLPRPADWGENIHITGYWFLDEPEWTPPQQLLDFLDSGKTPIYIGFGSMSGDDPVKTTKLILDAVVLSGERAIILGGWGGIAATDTPENVLFIDSAPHSWLFPRVAAVVHHGGAGTTAAGLRAGIPCVTVPHLADQFFWGKRSYELGVGTKPIPRKKLTSANLAAAICAVSDPAMRQRAAELGARIRAEDGVGTAIRLIERYTQ